MPCALSPWPLPALVMAWQFRKNGERELRAEVGAKVCVKFAHPGEKAAAVFFW